MKDITMQMVIAGVAITAAVIATTPVAVANTISKNKNMDINTVAPQVRLVCKTNTLTVINRGSSPVQIEQRTGRFFSLNPNYQIPVHVGSLKLKTLSKVEIQRLNGASTQALVVKSGAPGSQWSQFRCLIPSSCTSNTMGSAKSMNIKTNYLACKLLKQRF